MSPYRLLMIVSLLALATGCSTTKKAAKNAVVEQDLNAIEVVASRDNPYRAAATKEFNLLHSRIEVKFDYATQHLPGKATLTLQPHFYPQKELVLDAQGFDINEVSLVAGNNTREALKYTYDTLQLKIQLNKEYTRDDQLKIYIDYVAKPNENKNGGSAAITDDKGLYFINPLGKDTTKPIQVWTQGETESNSHWYPTIDKPNQKATDEIYITHLKKYVSLSNGTLISSTPVNDSMVADYWKMDLPHAPYLVMMAVGEFVITQDRWRDIPVNYYMEKAYAPYAKKIFGNTPEMMEFFSQKLGFDYPWQKYSQIVVRDYVSGAMENTSATLHGEFIQRTPRELLDETYEDVISHELFHQWFGDLVTSESWSNIPLNESFATYGEYLWNEYKYGRAYADYKQLDNFNKYMEEAKGKNVDLVRYYYDDREDMFDRHSYEKGGLLLHYLRKDIGDDAFFHSLELYLKTNQFKPVEMDMLRQAVEEITGRDMNWFFNQWFFNAGHPVLDIQYSYKNDTAAITIEQKHSIDKGLVYQLPAKLGIWQGSTVTAHDILLTKKKQTFTFPVKGQPTLVDFDMDRAVLCEKKENKSVANYMFQYRNTPLFMQKYEALKNIVEAQKQSPVVGKEVLVEALQDNFFYLREYAIKKIILAKDGSDSAVITTLYALAKSDKESSVRRAAIEKLGKLPGASKYSALFEVAVGDSSYQVAAEALRALNTADSKKAIQVAKGLENEKESSLAAAVADIYAKEGDAGYQEFFSSKLRSANNNNKYLLFYYYANFLTRMDKPVVLQGVKHIEEEAMLTESNFLLGAAKGALKRIIKSFEEKKKKAQTDLATEQSQTGKVDLQQRIIDYDLVVSDTNDALGRLNKKPDTKKVD